MILVLRALGVGDLVTAAPALRGLRLAFPRRRLVLAAPLWLAPLAELIGGVDEVVPTAALTGPAPACTPALAVNLHGRGPESHLLLRATGPGHLWGFHCPQAEHLDGPVWDPEEHEVRRWCRLLGWYGVDADPEDLALRRPAPDQVPVGVTVVHPGTKEPAKRPPASLFAEVAAELHRRGHHVVVTGSAAERDLAERVARDAGLPPTAVLAGRTTLTDLAALVAHARLVVGPRHRCGPSGHRVRHPVGGALRPGPGSSLGAARAPPGAPCAGGGPVSNAAGRGRSRTVRRSGPGRGAGRGRRGRRGGTGQRCGCDGLTSTSRATAGGGAGVG